MTDDRETGLSGSPGQRGSGLGGLNQGGFGEGSDLSGTSEPAGGFGGADAGSQGAMTDGAGTMKQKAAEARDRVLEEAESRIAERKDRAAGSLGEVARSLRTASEQLPLDNGMSRYMAQAANQVDNLASFLNNREVAEVMEDTEDFARRHPAAFIGGAFALGLFGARFLKSSRRELSDEGPRDDWGGRSLADGGRWSSGSLTDRGELPEPEGISRPRSPEDPLPSERGVVGDAPGGYR